VGIFFTSLWRCRYAGISLKDYGAVGAGEYAFLTFVAFGGIYAGLVGLDGDGAIWTHLGARSAADA